MDSDKGIPEESSGSTNAVEDGCGIREGRSGKSVGEGNELGNEELILFKPSLDYGSVNLVEMFDSFAGF